MTPPTGWRQTFAYISPKHMLSRFAGVLLGGFILPFSMAPYDWWPLSLVGLLFIAACLKNTSAKQSMALAFGAGAAMYASGVSWVYVAIAQFGASSSLLALALTALFILGLAAAFALPFYLYGRFLSRNAFGQTLGFAAIWVLGEWMRSWFLTGFPWLYIGYAHIDTPLSGYAPVLGVFGSSLTAAFSVSVLLWLILPAQVSFAEAQRSRTQQLIKPSIGFFVLALLWGSGQTLKSIEWTEQKPHTISVGLMQPNIPQERKWDPAFYEETINIFSELSEPLWQHDWVIWPEAAVPYPYHHAAPLLEQIGDYAYDRGTVFITGIIYDDYTAYKYYNAVIARGTGTGDYYKQRLVPFGEYVPFEEYLRGLIAFFDLPTSIIHIGPFNPMGLNANGVLIAANICYEIAYPDLIAKISEDKDVILTISNDAWFGDSNGPLQHFSMARMRAIETGRYVIRATNNGISGFITPQGKVTKTGGRFTREAITGEVARMGGNTPFMSWHSWPVVLMCLALLLIGFFIGIRSK